MKNFPFLPFIIFAGALITTATVGLPVFISWFVSAQNFEFNTKDSFEHKKFDFSEKEVNIRLCEKFFKSFQFNWLIKLIQYEQNTRTAWKTKRGCRDFSK